jgi:hypothetical protein
MAPRALHRTLCRLIQGGLGAAIILIWPPVLGGLANKTKPRATAEKLTPTPSGDGDAPRQIVPRAPILFDQESEEAVCIRRLVRSPVVGPRNVPYCCHLLRLYGLGPTPGLHFASGREALGALTDVTTSERYFGEPAFFPTRSGIRYRPPEHSLRVGSENHRDICLATFAEAGLPLSTEFSTPNETFHLRDLLSDSLANFHLKQDELAWTAVAYGLYLSPGRRWTNRFGETFGWDELTDALLAAPFARSSCGGTHLLYALILVRRLERVPCSLSAAVTTRLEVRLKGAIQSACALQASDGSWSMDWWARAGGLPAGYRPLADRSDFNRLLITGHLLECLTLAPPHLQPPADVYRRAARWLCHVLQDERWNSDQAMCPRTHAICAVRSLLTEREKLASYRLPKFGPTDAAGDGRPLPR